MENVGDQEDASLEDFHGMMQDLIQTLSARESALPQEELADTQQSPQQSPYDPTAPIVQQSELGQVLLQLPSVPLEHMTNQARRDVPLPVYQPGLEENGMLIRKGNQFKIRSKKTRSRSQK